MSIRPQGEAKRAAAGKPARQGIPLAIGAIFRESRESQQLTQAEVAEMTRGRAGQISRAMISLIERGHHLPGLEATVALARALNIAPMEIFELVDLEAEGATDLRGFDLQELKSRANESFWSGDYRRALAIYDAMLEALAAAPPDDPAERTRMQARVEINRAAALRRLCALTAARSAAERAISLAEGLADLQTEAYIVLATLLVQMGRKPLARDAAGRAVALSKLAGPKARGMAGIVEGEVAYASGDFETARQAFVKARQFVRLADDHVHRINVEGNIGECLRELGRKRLARSRIVRAVKLARCHGIPASEAFWLVQLGRLALDDDALDDAERFALAALRIAKPSGHLLTIFRAEWTRHLISLQREGADRHRLAFLRRLYAQLNEHRGVEEIREFRRTVLGETGCRGRGRCQ